MNLICFFNFSMHFSINKKVNIFALISPKKQLFIHKRNLIFVDPTDIKDKSEYIGDFTIEPYDYDTYKIKGGDGNLYIMTSIAGPRVNAKRKEFRKSKHFITNKSYKWIISEENNGVRFKSRGKCLHVEEIDGDFKRRIVKARKCANIEGQIFIVKESKNQSNTEYVEPIQEEDKLEEAQTTDESSSSSSSSLSSEEEIIEKNVELKYAKPLGLAPEEAKNKKPRSNKSPNDLFELLKDENSNKKTIRPKIVRNKKSYKRHKTTKPLLYDYKQPKRSPKFFVIKAY